MMRVIGLVAAALLFASQDANAAVVRFDFISEVSVYDPKGGCLESYPLDLPIEVVRDWCEGLEGPIYGQFTLEVMDPNSINFGATWATEDHEEIVEANAAGTAGRLLDFVAGLSCRAYCELFVTSIASGRYNINAFADDDPINYYYGNDGASWGGWNGTYYRARGYWTSTVLEPAPIPLPASGLLMFGLLLVGVAFRRWATGKTA